MSQNYPTLAEINAYDLGFAQAEDYWRDKTHQTIIQLLQIDINDCTNPAEYELINGLHRAIEIIKEL